MIPIIRERISGWLFLFLVCKSLVPVHSFVVAARTVQISCRPPSDSKSQEQHPLFFLGHTEAAATWLLQWGGGWQNGGSKRESRRGRGRRRRSEQKRRRRRRVMGGNQAEGRQPRALAVVFGRELSSSFTSPSLSPPSPSPLSLSIGTPVPLLSWLKEGASCSCCATLDRYTGAYSGADLSEFQWSWSKKKVLSQSWLCVPVYMCVCVSVSCSSGCCLPTVFCRCVRVDCSAVVAVGFRLGLIIDWMCSLWFVIFNFGDRHSGVDVVFLVWFCLTGRKRD